MEIELRTLSAIHAVDKALGSLTQPTLTTLTTVPASPSPQPVYPSRQPACSKGVQTEEVAASPKSTQTLVEVRSRGCQPRDIWSRNAETQTDTNRNRVAPQTAEAATQTSATDQTKIDEEKLHEEEIGRLSTVNITLLSQLESVTTRCGEHEVALLAKELQLRMLALQARETEARHSIVCTEMDQRSHIQHRALSAVTRALLATRVPSITPTVPEKIDSALSSELSWLLRECREVLNFD